MATNDEIDYLVRVFVRDVGVATLAANAAQRASTVGSAEKSLRNETERFTQAILQLKHKWERETLEKIDNPSQVWLYNRGLMPVTDRTTELTKENK